MIVGADAAEKLDLAPLRPQLDALAALPDKAALAPLLASAHLADPGGGLLFSFGSNQDFANSKKIYILRGDKRIPFNYKDVLHGKNMQQNVLLQPGDHVVVP